LSKKIKKNTEKEREALLSLLLQQLLQIQNDQESGSENGAKQHRSYEPTFSKLGARWNFSVFLTINYSISQFSMVKLPSIPIIPASKSVPQSNVEFGPSISR